MLHVYPESRQVLDTSVTRLMLILERIVENLHHLIRPYPFFNVIQNQKEHTGHMVKIQNIHMTLKKVHAIRDLQFARCLIKSSLKFDLPPLRWRVICGGILSRKKNVQLTRRELW